MAPAARRTRHELGRHRGETTLVQTFLFDDGVTAASIGEVLRSAPLVGPDSIFGERPGSEEAARDEVGRRLRGFSPVPGFRFDVELAEPVEGVFVASFAQPDLRSPYLEGDAVWIVSDGADGAVFEEEINTERALTIGSSPLTGPKRSLRRWLFFRVGHSRVMADATRRIAILA